LDWSLFRLKNICSKRLIIWVLSDRCLWSHWGFNRAIWLANQNLIQVFLLISWQNPFLQTLRHRRDPKVTLLPFYSNLLRRCGSFKLIFTFVSSYFVGLFLFINLLVLIKKMRRIVNSFTLNFRNFMIISRFFKFKVLFKGGCFCKALDITIHRHLSSLSQLRYSQSGEHRMWVDRWLIYPTISTVPALHPYLFEFTYFLLLQLCLQVFYFLILQV
jgi:hypothetical protein